MGYLSELDLQSMGFKALGKNVKISEKTSIYNPEKIQIGDNSRIDDFCVISGHVTIGRFCHITPMCLVAGGKPGIFMSDFCTLAYGVKVFSQSDDYSGSSMVNSLIPEKFKRETFEPVFLGRQVVVGAGAVILPGVSVGEGCSIGAMSLVRTDTLPWGIYAGVPVCRIRDRSKNIIGLEKQFLMEFGHDSI